ncbi:hypothetical protein FXO38_26870 [Capsicum annuum]|nr:hypothetical protein FXO38_26870 [Capsicum annuum]KAF3633215.1 hypothetical protein FXO37_27152 [Capsicum annuum]
MAPVVVTVGEERETTSNLAAGHPCVFTGVRKRSEAVNDGDNRKPAAAALVYLREMKRDIKTIPNQHRTDEELTTYSRSTFHEHSFAAKTKRWLEAYPFRKNALLILVVVGTCMVIGDGILTPAISAMNTFRFHESLENRSLLTFSLKRLPLLPHIGDF